MIPHGSILLIPEYKEKHGKENLIKLSSESDKV
jgi:hypothetical protein